MARRHARCRRGERLRAGVPFGHWKTTTFVAGLRRTGMVTPMVLDGPINREAFPAYVDQMLALELRPGDVDHGQPIQPQAGSEVGTAAPKRSTRVKHVAGFSRVSDRSGNKLRECPVQ